MINVIAFIHVKEGRLPAFVEIFKSNIPLVLQERGCIEYVPAVDYPSGFAAQKLDENVVTIIEKWESLADLQAHQSSAHMLAYKEKVKDLVDHVVLKVLKDA
ncbi:MAG: putative quinol monooxygenase [bacterium]